jgi:hypothetical protein
MLLGMHLNIAVLMGLPLFSAAMIVADAVFLPDRFYRSVAQTWRTSRTANWLTQRRSLSRWHKVPPQPTHPTVETPAKQRGDDSATAKL